MAKNKSKETKVINDAELDALVDEGKNIDNVKVAEEIAVNAEEEVSEEKVNVDDMIQETKEPQAEETIEGVIEQTDNVSEDESADEETLEENTNIDDVITECTDEIVEEKTKEVKSDTEPWYIARAKRISDYYNW